MSTNTTIYQAIPQMFQIPFKPQGPTMDDEIYLSNKGQKQDFRDELIPDINQPAMEVDPR
jgi:hypothetical protein